MTTLAVAGLSARWMAEAAADDGFDVVALDLFGDVDTCAVASRWFAVGEPTRLQIDGARLLATLERLARQGEVAGWVAGSGFEGQPELLASGAALLPLIGTAPEALARLRDPALFFAFLAEHDIEHPPVRLAWAGLDIDIDVAGKPWLLKDLHGCGGGHIRRAVPGEPKPMPPGHYLQQELAGQAMSVTFVANGRDAQVLGANLQIVRAQGASLFAFCGVVGPVPLAGSVLQRLQAILPCLTSGFELKGLASLDFLLDGGRISVLEVNARPPASLALYPHWQPMAAHVRACQHGELPAPRAAGALVRGHEIVFAPQPMRLGSAAAEGLAAQPDVHDVPRAGQAFAAGEPLCSVSASGCSAAEVLERLQARRFTLLQSLETTA
jgi:uncharacterized protein